METASILVVGGCGMTGSHIVGKLLAAYPRARVAVMSRNPTKNTFAGVSYHAGDMNRPGDVDAVLAAVQPTVVFHVVCLASRPTSLLSPSHTSSPSPSYTHVRKKESPITDTPGRQAWCS